LIFGLFLVLMPVLFVGLAAWLTNRWRAEQKGVLANGVQYAYVLVPLGFGIWLAHYGFHFLTGLYTVIPVTQNAAASLGWPVLGTPRWSLVGLPKNVVHAFEYG